MRAQKNITEHLEVIKALLAESAGLIDELGNMAAKTSRAGGTLYFCGNGGSAADSQHLAAEFTGRFEKERDGLPAIALSVNTSSVTAIGNDYSFDEIFSRPLKALGKSGDMLIAISTSGNSANVLRAIEVAKERGMVTSGWTGGTGGKMADMCDINILVPSKRTARIQEAHILIGHIMCEYIDESV